MPSPALAFAAGFGGGYMKQSQLQDELARQAKIDQMAQETHDAQMAEVQRQNQNRLSLAAAAAPAAVSVGAGGMTKPDYADNRDVGQPGEPGVESGGLVPGAIVNGQQVPDAAAATSAAAAYDDPNAVDKRVSLALAQTGDPAAAMAYRKNAFGFNKEQTEYARTLKNENALDTSKALVGGDPDEIKAAFNKTGDWKIVGDPVVKKRDRDDIPGIDSLPTNDVTVTLKGPDGQTITKTVNSYDFATHLMPYSDFLGQQIKGQGVENTAEYRGQIADARTTAANAQAMAAEAKAAALKANGGNLSHEERMRYTSLFSDAGRRMRDTQQTINTLQRDTLFTRKAAKDPASPEAQQLKQLQADLDSYRGERSTYQQLLAQGGPSVAAATPAGTPGVAATKAPVKVSSQAERDALPRGTTYIAPDGSTRIKQ